MNNAILTKTEKPKTIDSARENSHAKARQAVPSAPVAEITCMHNSLGNRAVRQVLQAKLKVNQPSDKYEQEADRMADLVMRMPDSAVQDGSHSPATVQRKCAACESSGTPCPKCADEEENIQRKPLAAQITPLLQRRENSAAAPEVTPQVVTQLNALRSGGQPLPEATRRFFEPRFGADFSDVRVHTGSKAANTARSLNARAFTLGKDMIFGAGQFAPESTDGRRMMAHELTHVVQQNDSTFKKSLSLKIHKSVKEAVREPCIQRQSSDNKDKLFGGKLASVLKETTGRSSVQEKIAKLDYRIARNFDRILRLREQLAKLSRKVRRLSK